MADRITFDHLAAKLRVLSQLLRTELELDKNAFGYRVVRNRGSRDLSPRMTSKEALLWLEAAIVGATETWNSVQNVGRSR